MRVSSMWSKASAFFAVLGAVLTLAVLFVAFRAEGARVAGPKDVSGLVGDWDASVTCFGVSDGTAVSSATDQSGAGNTATQGTGSRQPTCQTAAGDLVNGKPVFDFDGTDNLIAPFTSVGATSTVFIVADSDTSCASTYFFFDGDENTDRHALLCDGTTQKLFAGSLVASAPVLTTNVAHVHTAVINGASSIGYLDGVAGTTVNAGANVLSGLTIGCSNDGVSSCFNGQVMQTLVYDSALSDTDRRAIEKYLRVKWTGEKQPVPSFYVSGKLPAKQKQGNCTDSNVALWEDFEEASGNLTVPAGCAAASTVLTATGSPTYQYTGGNAPPGIGVGIQTDAGGGTDSFATAADVAALDLTDGSTSFVIEGWYRPASVAAGQTALVGKMTAAGVGWAVYRNGGGVTTAIRDATPNASNCVLTTGLTVGEWAYFRVAGTAQSYTCAINGTATTASTNDGTIDSIDTTAVVQVFTSGWGSLSNAAAGDALADFRLTVGNSSNSQGFNPGAHSGSSGSTLTAPTFTRATASTRVNPVTGLVESVASGVPVVGAPLSSGDDGSIDVTEPTGVYVGSATTFTALNNADFSQWSTATVTVTVNDATAPDGTVTADLLTPNNATNSWIRQALNVAGTCLNADTCTGTIWLKSASSSNVALSLTFYDNGQSDLIAEQAITVTPTWQRFVITGTGDADDGQWNFYVGNNNSWTSAEGAVHAWRGQGYEKPFAVPLDPAVTTSSVTVNADSVGYGPVSAYMGSTTLLSFCAWVNAPTTANTGNARIMSISDGSTAPNIFFPAGASTISVGDVGAGTQVAGSVSVSANTWSHVCATWDHANDIGRIFINGAVDTTNTAVLATDAPLTNDVWIGTFNGGNALSGFVSDARLYSSILSPQNVRALYLARSTTYARRDETPREKLRRKIMLASAHLDPWSFFGTLLDERARKAEEIAAAKRYVASDAFPEPALQVAQP